jgi:hypothetical protein
MKVIEKINLLLRSLHKTKYLETTKKSVVSGGINNHNNVFLSEVFI